MFEILKIIKFGEIFNPIYESLSSLILPTHPFFSYTFHEPFFDLPKLLYY